MRLPQHSYIFVFVPDSRYLELLSAAGAPGQGRNMWKFCTTIPSWNHVFREWKMVSQLLFNGVTDSGCNENVVTRKEIWIAFSIAFMV